MYACTSVSARAPVARVCRHPHGRTRMPRSLLLLPLILITILLRCQTRATIPLDQATAVKPIAQELRLEQRQHRPRKYADATTFAIDSIKDWLTSCVKLRWSSTCRVRTAPPRRSRLTSPPSGGDVWTTQFRMSWRLRVCKWMHAWPKAWNKMWRPGLRTSGQKSNDFLCLSSSAVGRSGSRLDRPLAMLGSVFCRDCLWIIWHLVPKLERFEFMQWC